MRVFVRLLGREMEKWGEMRKKWGKEVKGGVNEGRRGVDREMKVVQGVKNEGSTNRKSIHAVKKEGARRK